MSIGNGRPKICVYLCANSGIGSKLPSILSELVLDDDLVFEPVPCTGKIDPRYIMKAFEAGITAVCVLACPLRHCKTIEGNLRALRRVEVSREMISEAGLDPDAVHIFLPRNPGEETIQAAMEVVARSLNGRTAVKELVA